MLAIVVVAFVIQGLGWAWVGAGIRRVREDASALEADPPLTVSGETPPPAPDPTVGASRQLARADLEAVSLGHPDPAPSTLEDGLPITVVVAAHNEADRLPALLDALDAQTHRPFEVVVVDDRSTDRTGALVHHRAPDFPAPLRLVRVEDADLEAAGLPPKKHALERGLEAATHDRIAFTDADGRPDPKWLATLARWASLEDGTRPRGQRTASRTTHGLEDAGAMLIGYGPYLREPDLLNRFVRYETVTTAALAAAAVGWGRPWHAVGRNLSVPTSLLREIGGYAHSAGSLSGDDDLLVQEVAALEVAPVRYVWSPAAVPSPAPPDWAAFWRQKRRHASAGSHYPTTVLAALGLFNASSLTLWIGAPVLHLATGVPFGWGLLAAKLLLQRSVLADVLDGLGDEPDLRLWQPVLDGLSAVYHAAFSLLGLLPTPTRW